MMRVGNKRGQIALFVIIAIVIVAIILVFLLYPGLRGNISGTFIPQTYLKDCVETGLKENLQKIADQGGYSNPEGYLNVNGTKVKFLCYTSEYYKTCYVQQPMIVKQVENELYKSVKPKLVQCVNSLKQAYEKRGYSVSSGNADADITFMPGSILIKFNAPMTLTKDTSQTFKEFEVKISSSMYDLLSIAQSIVSYESTYGDSETTLYLQYYPNLRIDKTKMSEGTKLYKVSDVVTGESFTFASRSLSWPPGYGFEEVLK